MVNPDENKAASIHDVVQLTPDFRNPAFAGALGAVSDVKASGVIVYVTAPSKDNKGTMHYYVHADWTQFVLIGGKIVWPT